MSIVPRLYTDPPTISGSENWFTLNPPRNELVDIQRQLNTISPTISANNITSEVLETFPRILRSSKQVNKRYKWIEYERLIRVWETKNLSALPNRNLSNTHGLRLKRSKRSIELELLKAISDGKDFETKTTKYLSVLGQVYLFGSIVADLDENNAVAGIKIFGDSEYNKKLSRLRLNQLNIKIKSYKGKNKLTHFDGTHIFVPYDSMFTIPEHYRVSCLPSGLRKADNTKVQRSSVQYGFMTEGLGLPYLKSMFLPDGSEIKFKYRYSATENVPIGIQAEALYNLEKLYSEYRFGQGIYLHTDRNLINIYETTKESLVNSLRYEIEKKKIEEGNTKQENNGWWYGQYLASAGITASTLAIYPSYSTNTATTNYTIQNDLTGTTFF